VALKLWRRQSAGTKKPASDGAEAQRRGRRGDPGDTPETPRADDRTQRVERLFREHNEALIRFLQARVGSYQEAREVAQEAYVRLLSLDQPDAVSYLRAFLFKTAANIAIDRQRRDRTHDRAMELPLFNDFADTRTPERRLASTETLNQLERLIAAMPAKCQQSFVLNQIYGVDTATVATELGLSESMVRRYVARALLLCRSQLDLKESGND
jgi:RNA polymerase sigma-70 factor (ECF subfamily)